MSYGYDSTTAFSRSIGSIGSVAEDLLDRLKVSRPDEINRSRPILLIAHSHGGLIVKKAMNTAWFKIGDRFNPYGDLLENVRGLIVGLCPLEYPIVVPILYSGLDCQQAYLTKVWRGLMVTQDS